MWIIGVEAEQETSAPPPKKDPGSVPGYIYIVDFNCCGTVLRTFFIACF